MYCSLPGGSREGLYIVKYKNACTPLLPAVFSLGAGTLGLLSSSTAHMLDLSHEEVACRGVAAPGVCLLSGCPHKATSPAQAAA